MKLFVNEERPIKRLRACDGTLDCDDVGRGAEEQENISESSSAAEDGGQVTIGTDTPVNGLAPVGLPLSKSIPNLVVRTEPTTGKTGQFKVGNTVLQSLQRRFASQQQLETPYEKQTTRSTPKEDETADTDGFVLYSQPTYERALSQLPEEEATPPQPLIVTVESSRDSRQDAEETGQLDSHRGPAAKEQDHENLETSGLTPAVHSADRVQLNKRDSLGNGVSGIFPIFRSKKDCKTLYIIRHGESEYNAACAAMGSRWEDPIIFDAPLTNKGKRQAIALREQVSAWNLPSDVVWITSPLSRAIETLLLVLQGGSATPIHNSEDSKVNTLNANLPVDRIHVLAEVTERLVTSGDIGRHPSDLSQKFPSLAKQLESLPLVWWYNHPNRENCCYRGLFNASEPKDEMQRRIKRFRKWMVARPERVFVAVGHSMYWKAFATACKNGIKQDALRNCGWMVLHV